jgi:tRNA G26 N,N-dimethylase Trm1
MKLNNIKEDKDKFVVYQKDSNKLMYSRKDKYTKEGKVDKFSIIDLDPYGTAIPFLDTAI